MELEKVFGISVEVNEASYVDRANLDGKLKRLLKRDVHIAMKGASKSGKSWLRKQCIQNANVVQCRMNKSVEDIYVEALANLDVTLVLEQSETSGIKGTIEAAGEAGNSLLAKIKGKSGVEAEKNRTVTEKNLKYDLKNLKFIADIINASDQKLIIEDFHYLSVEARKQFAFDLKTLWDYKCFVVVIGVWTQSNLLTFLNPDLSGRIEEVSVLWNPEDLRKVLIKGCKELNASLSYEIENCLVEDSFGNVGILQALAYLVFEKEGIFSTLNNKKEISNRDSYIKAAQLYANQLDGLYQRFAKNLSTGIRNRHNSTGIYGYTMKAIVEAPNEELQDGLTRDKIYTIISRWEPRIQKGNLGVILRKLVDIQVESDSGGLTIGYDESTDSVLVVDRQLLFYRKHHTMKWPWDDLVQEEDENVIS